MVTPKLSSSSHFLLQDLEVLAMHILLTTEFVLEFTSVFKLSLGLGLHLYLDLNLDSD